MSSYVSMDQRHPKGMMGCLRGLRILRGELYNIANSSMVVVILQAPYAVYCLRHMCGLNELYHWSSRSNVLLRIYVSHPERSIKRYMRIVVWKFLYLPTNPEIRVSFANWRSRLMNFWRSEFEVMLGSYQYWFQGEGPWIKKTLRLYSVYGNLVISHRWWDLHCSNLCSSTSINISSGSTKG